MQLPREPHMQLYFSRPVNTCKCIKVVDLPFKACVSLAISTSTASILNILPAHWIRTLKPDKHWLKEILAQSWLSPTNPRIRLTFCRFAGRFTLNLWGPWHLNTHLNNQQSGSCTDDHWDLWQASVSGVFIYTRGLKWLSWLRYKTALGTDIVNIFSSIFISLFLSKSQVQCAATRQTQVLRLFRCLMCILRTLQKWIHIS